MENEFKVRTGVVLAAGMNSRMRPGGDDSFLKPLASVDRVMLLARTLKSLEIAGCHKCVVVVGWQAEVVKSALWATYTGPMELIFTYNDKYRLQNGISVLSAKEYLRGPFILTMADHILDAKIMQLAAQHAPIEKGACLCVDFKINTIFDIDDATKVFAKDGKIISIGKDLEHFNCIDTGVFVCTKGLIDAIEFIYRRTGDASLSQGIQCLADKGIMECIDIKEAFWQDVDTVEMLQHAETLLRKYDET